jgi:hypothetical protein
LRGEVFTIQVREGRSDAGSTELSCDSQAGVRSEVKSAIEMNGHYRSLARCDVQVVRIPREQSERIRGLLYLYQ